MTSTPSRHRMDIASFADGWQAVELLAKVRPFLELHETVGADGVASTFAVTYNDAPPQLFVELTPEEAQLMKDVYERAREEVP